MFSIPFFWDFKYFKDDIQLSINFKPKIKQLLNFFEKYQKYPINIIIQDTIDRTNYKEYTEIFKVIKENYPNADFRVGLPPYISKKDMAFFVENFPVSCYSRRIIESLDDFNDSIAMGASDIFIGGLLGSYLPELHLKAAATQCKIRTYCNYAFVSSIYDNPLKSFFIRPEDIDLYAEYIDIFEIAKSESLNDIIINTYYEIYAKDKVWHGPLEEIILNYPGTEDNRTILPFFAERKIKCKKRCSYQVHNICQFCDIINDFSQTVIKNNLTLE